MWGSLLDSYHYSKIWNEIRVEVKNFRFSLSLYSKEARFEESLSNVLETRRVSTRAHACSSRVGRKRFLPGILSSSPGRRRRPNYWPVKRPSFRWKLNKPNEDAIYFYEPFRSISPTFFPSDNRGGTDRFDLSSSERKRKKKGEREREKETRDLTVSSYRSVVNWFLHREKNLWLTADSTCSWIELNGIAFVNVSLSRGGFRKCVRKKELSWRGNLKLYVGSKKAGENLDYQLAPLLYSSKKKFNTFIHAQRGSCNSHFGILMNRKDISSWFFLALVSCLVASIDRNRHINHSCPSRKKPINPRLLRVVSIKRGKLQRASFTINRTS